MAQETEHVLPVLDKQGQVLVGRVSVPDQAMARNQVRSKNTGRQKEEEDRVLPVNGPVTLFVKAELQNHPSKMFNGLSSYSTAFLPCPLKG